MVFMTAPLPVVHAQQPGLTAVTAGDILKKIGLSLDLEKLSKVEVVANPDKVHNACPLTITGDALANLLLAATDPFQVRLITPSLTPANQEGVSSDELLIHALDSLVTRLLMIERSPAALTRNKFSEWPLHFKYLPAPFHWEDILLSAPSGASFSALFKRWVHAKIAENKSAINTALLLDLETNYGQPVSLDAGPGNELYLVRPLDPSLYFEHKAVMEQTYGHVALDGAVTVPETMLHALSFTSAHRYASSSDWNLIKELLLEAEKVWFLGTRACTRPILFTEAHTPEVVEIAVTLLEQMTLEEAFEAAVKI